MATGDLTVVDELGLASKAPQPELGYFGWYPWLGNSKFSYIFKHHNRSPFRDSIFDNILDIQPNQQFCEVQLARHRLAMCKAE